MAELALTILKLFLFIFGSLGIAFHLLALRNPEESNRMEQSLGTEFGLKKRIIPGLEKNRAGLHERLMRSKLYNILALIFLVILFVLLFQI